MAASQLALSTPPRVVERSTFNTEGTGLHKDLELGEVLDSKDNKIVVSGGPGTGKSYHTRKLIERAKNEGTNVIVVAPTGAAAAEYQNGKTIHSYLGLNGLNSLLYTLTHYAEGQLYEETLKGPTLMIVDEASFLDGRVIDELFNLADKLGFKICLVMDPAQLLGVKVQPFFLSLRLREVKVIRLTKVVRQKDQDFAEVISLLRGKDTAKKENIILNYLLSRGILLDSPSLDPNEVDICLSRKMLQERNNIRLLQFVNSGSEGKDLYCYKGLGNSPLYLCKGCPVIIRKNDKEKGVVNGDLGKVVHLSTENICIYVNRLDKEVTYEIQIESQGKLKEYKEGYVPQEGEVVLGLPIQLAFALTLHLSQGKTFENVQLFLEQHMTTMHGGAFVGITRHTTSLKVVCPVDDEGVFNLDFLKASFFFEEKALEFV